MQSEAHSYPIYNYPDIFSEYFFGGEVGCTRHCPEYSLVFVFSGELSVSNYDCENTIRRGEYIFLRKDINTMLRRKEFEGEAFSSIFMGISQNFLFEFYRNMKKKNIHKNAGSFPANIIELPCSPYLESVYRSLLPYLQWKTQPMDRIVEIKLMEAIFSLLLVDERFHSCLFDFRDKVDSERIVITTDRYIQNFVISNFSEFLCNGFSASYPRNNIKNEASCLQCKMTKELETDYIRLQHRNATNIYMGAGYKNMTRITRIFENLYYITTLN